MNKLIGLIKRRQSVSAVSLLLTCLLGTTSLHATDAAFLIDAEGIVQEVSVATGQVLITGIRYDVEPHAEVKVRGVVSSIAALEEGMKVRFVYEVIEGLEAVVAAREESSVITVIEQLPDSYVVEEF